MDMECTLLFRYEIVYKSLEVKMLYLSHKADEKEAWVKCLYLGKHLEAVLLTSCLRETLQTESDVYFSANIGKQA